MPLQAPFAQVGALQSPPAQSNWQVAPSSQLALGQTEPPPAQENLQVESFWQVTARSRQLPDELHSKLQVLPTPQVACPLQTLPPALQMKSQSAPG